MAGAGGLTTTAAAIAAPAIAQPAPEISWRLAASWPKSLETLFGGCAYFSKRVAEITDNRFKVQAFAAGEIVPGLQVVDTVQNGTIEMGNTVDWVLGKYDHGNPPALKRLVDAGAQLRSFPQEIVEVSYTAANKVYRELSRTNPVFKKLYDSV